MSPQEFMNDAIRAVRDNDVAAATTLIYEAACIFGPGLCIARLLLEATLLPDDQSLTMATGIQVAHLEGVIRHLDCVAPVMDRAETDRQLSTCREELDFLEARSFVHRISPMFPNCPERLDLLVDAIKAVALDQPPTSTEKTELRRRARLQAPVGWGAKAKAAVDRGLRLAEQEMLRRGGPKKPAVSAEARERFEWFEERAAELVEQEREAATAEPETNQSSTQ